MLYVDTSVLVALCTHEEKTAAVLRWYGACKDELASATWCVTEFASALGLKQRTAQLSQEQARSAWLQFERMCANDLQLLPLEPQTFHEAALLTLDVTTGLRAGDALHLACALAHKARAMVTLDALLARSAKQFKLKPITLDKV